MEPKQSSAYRRLTDEGEGVCLGGLGLLAGEGGLDLVKPAEGGEVRGRRDATVGREEVERPAGGHGCRLR